MNHTSMITALGKIEDELPALLRDDVGWMSLDINYHPPFVERLWRQHGEYRIYLHRIHPCNRDQALMHPHPWPSATRVIDGTYEMGIGYGGTINPNNPAFREPPPVTATIYTAGGLFVYEMIDPQGWHYVRPVAGVVHSVMISGPKWPSPIQTVPVPKMGPLPPHALHSVLGYFREIYQ